MEKQIKIETFSLNDNEMTVEAVYGGKRETITFSPVRNLSEYVRLIGIPGLRKAVLENVIRHMTNDCSLDEIRMADYISKPDYLKVWNTLKEKFTQESDDVDEEPASDDILDRLGLRFPIR